MMQFKLTTRLACTLAFAALLLVAGCEDRGSPPTPVRTAAAPRPPAVADPSDWCGEHGLPESMCTRCDPSLASHFQQEGNWCEEHGFPGSVCPFCNPIGPPEGAPRSQAIAPGTRIRLQAPGIERAAGIETVPAENTGMSVGVECTARIDFDRDRMADVRSPVPGIVREVSVDLGQQVAEADTMFVLESAQIGDLQARGQAARERVAAARADLARREKLREGAAIASQRQVELARQDLEVARADLRSIEQSLRISGASRSGSTGRFSLQAPIAGTVVRRPAVVGSYAGESDSLATVVDTSAMWALLDVSEWDAVWVHAGQEVEVRVDGIADRTFTGTVTWIASEVDPRTRTVTVRAEVQNTGGLLRANQFARATVHLAALEGAATVPREAVQRVGEESVVFVRAGEGLYEPRVVRPGRSDGRRIQVTGDVRAGDPVVTTGAFLLRTELSRESIGAGCSEVAPPGGS